MAVSVIIPCYNQGHFLSEAIESALAQMNPSVEVIVVDDGSSDSTAMVAESYKSVRCISQENRGLCGARLRGFEESTGDFLVFLDADDRLPPEAINHGLEALRANPRAVFAFGGLRRISPHGSVIGERRQSVTCDYYRELLKDNYIPAPGMVLFRRACLTNTGLFDDRFPATADYELYLRISRRMQIVSHPYCTIERRVHSESMSRNAEVMLKSVLLVHKREQRHLGQSLDLQAAYRQGRKFWKSWYGQQLATKLRLFRYWGNWKAFRSGIITLAHLAPSYVTDALVQARVSAPMIVSSDPQLLTCTEPETRDDSGLQLKGVSLLSVTEKERRGVPPETIVLSIHCTGAKIGSQLLIDGEAHATVHVSSDRLIAYAPKRFFLGKSRAVMQLLS